MNDILYMDLSQYLSYLRNTDEDEITKLISNEKFIDLPDNKIIATFSNLSDKNKKIFIDNNLLLYKLLVCVTGTKAKFNLIDLDYQNIIINKPNVFIPLNQDIFETLINCMDTKSFDKLINNIKNYIKNNDIITNNSFLNDIKNLYNEYDKKEYNGAVSNSFKAKLLDKFNIVDDKEIEIDYHLFASGKRNVLNLYKMESKEQLYVYCKFDIVVKKELFESPKLEIYNISCELLDKLNSKHVMRLIDELNKKEHNLDKTDIFITAVKMYSLFGLDNSLKIINDKLTYSTDRSLNRAANFNFIYERRNYRLTHYDEFYSYGLVEKLKKSIQHNEKNIVKKISAYKNDEYIINLYNNIKDTYTLNKKDNNMIEYFNQTIKEEIKKREEVVKEKYISNYKAGHNNKRGQIKCDELFNLFGEYDTFLTEFDEFGNVIMNKELSNFLIGHAKVDDDNLLRIIFNHQGLEYNNELINIINKFNDIIKITESHSLIDVLSAYKIVNYKLTHYDEKDMPLSVISAVKMSKKHLIVSEEEAFTRFKRTYRNHKLKISSTIPRVKGTLKNNVRYKLLDKNDPEQLICGILTHCCFKSGALGEDFYNSALTEKYADVIGIWTSKNKFFICPIIRNGNGVYGNGIEPSFENEEERKEVLNALIKCFNEIIKDSKNEEKIDFCTLTSLHDFVSRDDNFKEFDMKEIPMNEYFYSDITKNDLNNFVISGDAYIVKKYEPKLEYFIKRNKNLVYSKKEKENQLLIEQKIDEINYKAIDLSDYSDEVKEVLKKTYKPISIDKFYYITCNEDWYIGLIIKENGDIDFKGNFLHYDKRASKEFMDELKNLKTNYKIILAIEESKERKVK